MAVKKKIYKYHTSHSYKDVATGLTSQLTTQLYQIGVYGIINNNPSLQFSTSPSKLMSTETKLKKAESKGEITDLKFGRLIEVQEVDGLWKEVIN